jgi:hypothetical protein
MVGLQVDIIVFGGVPASNPCVHGEPNNQVLAIRNSYRLTISWTYEGEAKQQHLS